MDRDNRKKMIISFGSKPSSQSLKASPTPDFNKLVEEKIQAVAKKIDYGVFIGFEQFIADIETIIFEVAAHFPRLMDDKLHSVLIKIVEEKLPLYRARRLDDIARFRNGFSNLRIVPTIFPAIPLHPR